MFTGRWLPSTVKGSAAPTQMASGPIPRNSSATQQGLAREAHFDFIRDNEPSETNDPHFETVQEGRCSDNLLKWTDPSFLCGVTFR